MAAFSLPLRKADRSAFVARKREGTFAAQTRVLEQSTGATERRTMRGPFLC